MINKVVSPGSGDNGTIFFRIKLDNGNLSIVGVEGPRSNGDCRGSCGQICGTKVVNYSEGWNQTLLEGFYRVWKKWHMNDTQPDCAHQEELGWNEFPIDESKPLNAHGKHFEGQKSDSWNMLGWVRPSEHPRGLLMAPCPVCGYKYGSAWLKREVPTAVIEILESLPAVPSPSGWWF